MRHICFFLVTCAVILSLNTHAQTVYEHVSNKNIYNFLTELATEKVVTINTATRPWSRKQIRALLDEATNSKSRLSKRQQKELEFYLEDYALEGTATTAPRSKYDLFKKLPNLSTTANAPALNYADKHFKFQLRPLWGYETWIAGGEKASHQWGGLEAHATYDNWGFYANLRDNHETMRMADKMLVTPMTGGVYKGRDGGVDYSEMRGGITYNWNWGTIGLIKDHIEWGTNYHGPNILSSRAPSFARIQLELHPTPWLDFSWYHGWLVSKVTDSLRTYTNGNIERKIFRPKYMAANMFTIKPWKQIHISVGNAIIYSDIDVQPAYLIPFMFYKSIDHTISDGADNQNSQMFADISIWPVKHLHMYGSIYFDEFKKDRVTNDTVHNFISGKAGFHVSGWPLRNISFTTEYTRSNPITWKHRIPSLTYATNEFNMGHYLRDNAEEIYLDLTWKPLRGLKCYIQWWQAQKGDDKPYVDGNQAVSVPVLKNIIWKENAFTLGIDYEIVSNTRLFTEYQHRNISGESSAIYSPEIYLKGTSIIYAGFNIGF